MEIQGTFIGQFQNHRLYNLLIKSLNWHFIFFLISLMNILKAGVHTNSPGTFAMGTKKLPYINSYYRFWSLKKK